MCVANSEAIATTCAYKLAGHPQENLYTFQNTFMVGECSGAYVASFTTLRLATTRKLADCPCSEATIRIL